MKKRWMIAAGLALCLVCLTGCFLKPAEAMYTLPAASEDFTDLQAKINRVQTELSGESAGAVEYAAPLQGDNTQTIQLQDLDGDGEQESAVAFFRVAGAEKPLRIYIFRQNEDTGYEVATVIEGDGSAVNSIYYADLDDKPGKELVVSWQMSEDVFLLSAYSVQGKEPAELMKAAYSSHYEVMDMDRDGRSEVLLVQMDPAEEDCVQLYDYQGGRMVNTASARLSQGADTLFHAKSNYVSGLLPALYVTSYYGEEELITDIFVMASDQLENVTLAPESGISESTIRATADVEAVDINRDYILELPRMAPMATTSAVEVFYTTTWEQYDKNGKAKAVSTTFHNTKDGWYLELPDSWEGRAAVQRSDMVTSNDSQRAITFGTLDEMTGKLEPFLTVYRFTGNNRLVRASRGNRFILKENSDEIFAAEFYNSGWDCGLDQESLKERFHLILAEW